MDTLKGLFTAFLPASLISESLSADPLQVIYDKGAVLFGLSFSVEQCRFRGDTSLANFFYRFQQSRPEFGQAATSGCH